MSTYLLVDVGPSGHLGVRSYEGTREQGSEGQREKSKPLVSCELSEILVVPKVHGPSAQPLRAPSPQGYVGPSSCVPTPCL